MFDVGWLGVSLCFWKLPGMGTGQNRRTLLFTPELMVNGYSCHFMSLNLVQWVLIHPHVSQKNGTLSIILLESVLCKTGSVPILRFSRTFLPPGVRSLSPKIPNSHSLQGWPSIFESRAWQYGSTWGIQPIQQAPLGDPPTSPTIDVHIVLLCLISV